MSEMTAVKTREKWVDDVKVIACILVVLGHFFQSTTKANILPANDLYKWFNMTIYYFHVPLFFANLSDAYAVRGTNKSCPTEDRCYECSSSCCTVTWNQFCRTDCSSVGYEENKIFRVLFVSQ